MGYLVDSNVLIDYVANRFSLAQLVKLDAFLDEALIISVVTKIETLGFNGNQPEEDKMNIFIGAATIIGLTDEVVEQTIQLRKTYKIKMPDAIIASTALVYNYTLLSRNKSDFTKIPGLQIIDPHLL
jgi:predicted nucleic acid-binding protein